MADAALRARPGRRWLNRLNPAGIAFFVVLLGIWQLIVGTHMVVYTYLPAPSAIARAGAHLIGTGALPDDMAHTLEATMIGWVLGSAAGLALGLALGLSGRLWRNSMATFEVLRALPAIAFVPAAVLLLGFSMKMEIVVAGYVVMWPVFLNTINGVHGVTPEHEDVARVMRLPASARIWKIVLPSATATIIVGLRLGLALSLALVVVAEMIGNPAGVGYSLVLQEEALQPANMFAYIVAIGIVGILLNACFVAAVRVLFPGPAASIGEATQ